jgi:chitodextrinase
VSLSWNASTDNGSVVGYRVYRDGSEIATATSTSYSDTGVTNGRSYSYRVTAVDAFGNESDLSAAAVIGVNADRTAPTAPTRLVATSPASGQVGLTWTAATDNVAVTGYQVFRSGTLIATLGATTSYTDAGPSPLGTYSYTVKATDAAGNVSVESDPAVITVGFSDAFETADFSRWTGATAMSLSSTLVYNGAYAARSTSGGAPSFLTRQTGTPQTTLYFRAFLNVVSQASTDTVNLMVFRTATGKALISIARAKNGTLALANNVRPKTYKSTTAFTAGRWHELQIRLTITGTGSTAQAWFDGAPVTALSKTLSLGTTPIGRLQLGDATSGRHWDLGIDKVGAGPAYLTY